MKLTVSTLFVLFASAAMAQTPTTTAVDAGGAPSTSTMSSGSLGQKKFEEDKNITDARLRADSGSLSRYSLKTSLGYSGPNLAHLDAKDQPNPDGSVGIYETKIKASLSARYRIDSTTTISLGTGLTGIHPLHGWDRTDVSSPYISYDWTMKAGGFQMRHSPGFSYITEPNYTKIGEWGAPNYYFNMVYDLGASNFAVGLDANIQYFLYNRDYEKKDGKAGRYNLSFTPNMKYNLSDKSNISFSVNGSFWNPRSLSKEDALWPRSPTSSLGFGYALKREIYLNPYLSFYPDKLSADRTSFNFSATVSVL